MIGHANDFSRALYAVVIGEVKDGELIKLGYHIYLPVSPCRSDMLPEGISIPATAGVWHRRQ